MQKKDRLLLFAGIIALILILIPISGCTTNGGGGAKIGTKDGALDFSLKIIESYIDGDVDAYISYCADNLYCLDGDGPLSMDEWEPILREDEPFPAGRDYSDYTMEDFFAAYEYGIYDYAQYRVEFDFVEELDFEDWTPDEDDFLFLANEKEEDEGFIWDDLLVFMVTCEKGHWELNALSG